MEPSEENYKTSEKYGEENNKTPYDDEEKLLGLMEPNSKSAPPDYIDAPEASPDYGKKSESQPPRISPWKRVVFFLIFASICVSICLMGDYNGLICLIGVSSGATLANKYRGTTNAVSDKIPSHKMTHKVEGVALGGEYMSHHGLEGHNEGHHHDLKGHYGSMGSHHQVHADNHDLEVHDELEGHDDSQYRPTTMSVSIVFILTTVTTTALLTILVELLKWRYNSAKRSSLATQQ